MATKARIDQARNWQESEWHGRPQVEEDGEQETGVSEARVGQVNPQQRLRHAAVPPRAGTAKKSAISARETFIRANGFITGCLLQSHRGTVGEGKQKKLIDGKFG